MFNVHHRDDRPIAREPGTLTFESRADGLYLRATSRHKAEADDALALVRAEVLTGLSVEFRADEEKMVAGVRGSQRPLSRASRCWHPAGVPGHLG